MMKQGRNFKISDFAGREMAEVEIKNSHQYVEVKFIERHSFISADDAVEKIINRNTGAYETRYNWVNSKEYKKYLERKIKKVEEELEFLKFCKRIAGRKIKEVR